PGVRKIPMCRGRVSVLVHRALNAAAAGLTRNAGHPASAVIATDRGRSSLMPPYGHRRVPLEPVSAHQERPSCRLADLEQVPVGIAEEAPDLSTPVVRRREEFGAPVAQD